MTKKKSIWAFVLALCLIVPAMFMLTACGHTHTFSKEWTKNETHHWYAATCEHADEKGSYGEHVYDNDTDRDCNTCGYVRAIANEISFNSIETRTYNKTAQPLKSSEYTVAHDAGEVKIEYKLKGAEDNTYSTTAPVNAGEYTVRVTVKGNESYQEASNTNDFIISPYILNEAKGHHSKVYDGNVNIVKKFEIFEGDRISVQMLMTSKNVGASLYQAVINGPGNSNYQLPAGLSGMSAEITKRKLNNLDLKLTSTDIPAGSTGMKTINFTLDSNVVACDKGKVIVKVTFKAELILNETTLDLIANNSYDTESEAKIEFKTDGDTAYQNYEFDTTNLGTISFQN